MADIEDLASAPAGPGEQPTPGDVLRALHGAEKRTKPPADASPERVADAVRNLERWAMEMHPWMSRVAGAEAVHEFADEVTGRLDRIEKRLDRIERDARIARRSR